MNKMKIYLYGRHCNRTPFSYPAYRHLFEKRIHFVNDYRQADYLVAGYIPDLVDNSDDVYNIINGNRQIELVVLSEEPLWDTLWKFNDFQNPIGINNRKTSDINWQLKYHILNHITTNIYNFEYFPYFLTTDDEYFLRFSNLFLRNAKQDASFYIKNWQSAQIRFASYAARRVDDRYNVRFKGDTIIGLSSYRSLIAEGVDKDGALLVGEGWGSEIRRQSLPDWHLDKLVALNRQAFIVSALENTHLSNYVSEKLFDAFAVQAIPLYYAQPSHGAFRFVEDGSFINLAGLTVEQALVKIKNFTPDKNFINRYRSTQSRLAKLFSSPRKFIDERKRVVSETLAAFYKI